MNSRALLVFVAVAESGSFSRAGERLFMTQSAVSKRIAALEEELGAVLIDRLGRALRLTEAGETLLSSARRVLAELDAARQEINALVDAVGDGADGGGGDLRGTLRIATSHHVGIHRLPPVLKSFVQRHPRVELDLLFMDSEQACERIADGTVELAIVTLPDIPIPALETALVWPDPLSIVGSADHPLLGGGRRAPGSRPKSVDPARLADHPAILPGRGTITRRILLDALAPLGITVRTSLETNYLETIKMMVSVGLGWSVLPVQMLDAEVVAIPVKGMMLERGLGTVRQRGRTPTRAGAAFFETLCSSMRPSGKPS